MSAESGLAEHLALAGTGDDGSELLPSSIDIVKTVALLHSVDFSALDVNDDNDLTIDEFESSLKAIPGFGDDTWVARTLFNLIDKNHDGHVTPREYFMWKEALTDEKLVSLLEAHYVSHIAAKGKVKKKPVTIETVSTAEITAAFETEATAESETDAIAEDIATDEPMAEAIPTAEPKVAEEKVTEEKVAEENVSAEIPTEDEAVGDAFVDAAIDEVIGALDTESESTETPLSQAQDTDQLPIEVLVHKEPVSDARVDVVVADKVAVDDVNIENELLALEVKPEPEERNELGVDKPKKPQMRVVVAMATLDADTETDSDSDEEVDEEKEARPGVEFAEAEAGAPALGTSIELVQVPSASCTPRDDDCGVVLPTAEASKEVMLVADNSGSENDSDNDSEEKDTGDGERENSWSRSLSDEDSTSTVVRGWGFLAALDIGAELKRNKSQYMKLKLEEEEEEMKREAEEEKELEKAIFSEQFDLSLGLLSKDGNQIYKNNYRPLIYTVLNMALMSLSLFSLKWTVCVPGVFLNAVVLALGIISEIFFNIMGMCCGKCIRKLFRYYPGSLHYCAMDAWFNIEAYRDKSAGVAMVSEKTHDTKRKKKLELAADSMTPASFGSVQSLSSTPPKKIEAEDKATTKLRLKEEKRLEKEEKKKEHDLEKQRKKLADLQIVPPPFGYILVIGWLIVHSILLCSNAFYSYEGELGFYGNHKYDGELRGSWAGYCSGGNVGSMDAKKEGACLIRYSGFLVIVSFPAFCFFCSLVLFRNLRKTPLAMIKVAQLGLLSKFPGKAEIHTSTVDSEAKPGAAALLARIEAALLKINSIQAYKWRINNLFWCTGIKLVFPYMTVLNTLFSAALIIGPLLLVRGGYLLQVKFSNWWPLLIFGLSVGLTIHNVSLIFAILWRVHNFYAIGYQTMRVLNEPLHVTSIEDLMVWWETRKYFQAYRLPVIYIYGSWAVMFVAVVSLMSLAFILMNILLAPNTDEAINAAVGSPLNFSLTGLVICLCIALFKILKLVVAVSQVQIRHRTMLRHELVRLDAYGALFSRRIQETAAKRQKVAIEKETRHRESVLQTQMTQLATSTRRMTGTKAGVSVMAVEGTSRRRLHSQHQKQAMSTVDSLLEEDENDVLEANAIIEAFQDAGPVAVSLDDMKVEKQIATVGKDSHKLILSMLHIIENMDVYPTVMGMEITYGQLVIVTGYLVGAAVAVVGKVVFDI